MLATLDEVIRGLSIGIFGGIAGTCVVTFPGSPLWLVPAGMAVGGCALTIPEIRSEVQALLPATPPRLRLPGSRSAQGTGRERPQERTGTPATNETAPLQERPETPGTPLQERLDTPPHRLIVGHTGGGKTTLIHDLASRWATQDRVIVCDPDAAPGLWPGCEVSGYGDDTAAIARTLQNVQTELQRRRELRATGTRSFAPLHLVIDEAHILREIPDALGIIEDILRRGRKLQVRATLGTQDTQVATLGFEGKSALLSNLQRVDVIRRPDGRRVARFGKGDEQLIPNLPDPERLIVRAPRVIRVHAATQEASGTPEQDELLSSLLASVPAPSGRAGNVSGGSVDTVPEEQYAQAGNSVAVAEQGGDVTINVTQVMPPRLSGSRGRNKADTAELEAAYEERGRAGVTFRVAYAELKGGKETAHTAWKKGRDARIAT